MITIRTKAYSHMLSKYFNKLDSGLYECQIDDAVEEISNIALDIILSMSRCTEGLFELTKDYCNRKILNNIRNDVLQYLNTCQIFNLDGYICFCSREYLDRINTFLINVCKKISIQEKRDKLLADLKKYVSYSKPHKELVFLDHTGSGIEIFDMNYKRLMPEATRLYAKEYGDNGDDVLAADIVLHYLLKTLPKMILIRTKNENPFIQTLKQVFDDRVFAWKENI